MIPGPCPGRGIGLIKLPTTRHATPDRGNAWTATNTARLAGQKPRVIDHFGPTFCISHLWRSDGLMSCQRRTDKSSQDQHPMHDDFPLAPNPQTNNCKFRKTSQGTARAAGARAGAARRWNEEPQPVAVSVSNAPPRAQRPGADAGASPVGQLSTTGYFARIAPIRVSAFSAAACGVIPSRITSASAAPQSCWAFASA